jgi:hypothetical protein
MPARGRRATWFPLCAFLPHHRLPPPGFVAILSGATRLASHMPPPLRAALRAAPCVPLLRHGEKRFARHTFIRREALRHSFRTTFTHSARSAPSASVSAGAPRAASTDGRPDSEQPARRRARSRTPLRSSDCKRVVPHAARRRRLRRDPRQRGRAPSWRSPPRPRRSR